MMKWHFLHKLRIFLIFLVLCIGSWPVPGRANEDYEFYKKYGHTNKQWNEAVKKGFEAYDQQDCSAAVQYLKEAVSQQCQDGLVYFKLAVCSELTGSPYTAMQYYELALEKLQELKAIHPYQRDIFENYGRALFKAKKYDEALPYLTRAAAVGTPSFGLYYMVGFLYARKNDMNAALDFYKRALAQDTTGVPPDLLSEVNYEVAQSYYEMKDYHNASILLDKALQLDPTNEPAKALKHQVSLALQQKSVVDMIENLSEQQQQKTTTSPSAPPPPAAANLPPLQGGTQDSTPPLGSAGNPASPLPVAPPSAPSSP